MQVAFGQTSVSSTSLTKWGMPEEGSVSKTEDLMLQDSVRGIKEVTVSSLSTSVVDETRGGPIVHVDTSRQKLQKDYIEPWVTFLCNISVFLQIQLLIFSYIFYAW